jgi:hypothetical protein
MALIKLEDLQISTSPVVDNLTLAGIQGGSDKDNGKCFSYYGCHYGYGKGKGEYDLEDKGKKHGGKFGCDD